MARSGIEAIQRGGALKKAATNKPLRMPCADECSLRRTTNICDTFLARHAYITFVLDVMAVKRYLPLQSAILRAARA